MYSLSAIIKVVLLDERVLDERVLDERVLDERVLVVMCNKNLRRFPYMLRSRETHFNSSKRT